jgi:hypothetical protein
MERRNLRYMSRVGSGPSAGAHDRRTFAAAAVSEQIRKRNAPRTRSSRPINCRGNACPEEDATRVAIHKRPAR